jgi:HAD superfamily hydrolase (TIGR01509 family)
MNLIKEVNKRKMVIFDFDGLMVNSEQVIFTALRKLFTRYEVDLTWSYFAQHIGTPVHISLPQFFNDHPIPLSYDDFLIQRNMVIKKEMESSLRLMPGLTSLITLLNKKKYILSIGTSAKKIYLENILHKYHIHNFFKYVVTIDDVKRGKPDPDLFLEVLKQANVSSKDAFILEDSPSGIQAAKAAKIMSIAIPAPEVNLALFSDSTFIIDSLESLAKSLDKTC